VQSDNNTLDLDTWVFLTYVYHGSASHGDRIRMYANGVRIDTSGSGGVQPSSWDGNNPHLHVGHLNGSNDTDAKVFDIRVYQGYALTSGDQAELIAGPEPTYTTGASLIFTPTTISGYV